MSIQSAYRIMHIAHANVRTHAMHAFARNVRHFYLTIHVTFNASPDRIAALIYSK